MSATAYQSERWVVSKDGRTQALILLDDDLHLLTWGRLRTESAPVKGVAIITLADPEAWIRAERVKLPEPVEIKPDLFARRYYDSRRAA